MEEDGPVYFLERNADPRDHRRAVAVRPGRAVAIAPPSGRVSYVAPAAAATPVYQQPQFIAQPQPQFVGQPQFAGQPVYSPGPFAGQWGSPFMGQLGSLFGGITLGDIAKLLGFGFAAFKSLPNPPPPTGDTSTDIANEVLFVNALAEEQKLEKQIEFGASVIGELLGAR
jgi:hypothetical protein